eukprot:152600_1
MGNQQAKTTKPTTPSNLNQTLSSMTAISTRNDWQLSHYDQSHESKTPQSPNSPSKTPQSPSKTPQSPSKLDNLTVKAAYRTQKRRSSLLMVNNGITGKFISSRICKIAAKFWRKHVETLSHAQQLEISCSICFGMMAANDEMHKLMNRNLHQSKTMKNATAKYLDMMGWLIRQLVSNNIDLYHLLDKLGAFHRQIGIQIRHFPPMLAALHDTFAHYFKNNYNIEVKYAMDEIFSFTAQIMTGQNLNCSSHLRDITKQFEDAHIPFLKNLNTCLTSSIGREYLFRYLSQTWCDEIVLFFKSLQRFKHLMSDKERFFVAREITKHSIDSLATFTLNLSYEQRAQALQDMAQLEAKYANQTVMFEVPITLFEEIERELLNLISATHWIKFVDNIKTLQSKSFELKYMN